MSDIADMVLIGDLIARLTHTADHGTPDEYLALFAPDAVWDLPDVPGIPAQVRSGRDEIAEGVAQRREAGTQGPGTATRHVVTGVSVVPQGDRATAVSYWRFYADTDRTPRLTGMGVYHDEFVRVDGRWLLAYRRISVG